MSETIAALATAYGIGSVSIVRLSGKDALATSLKLLKLSNLEPRYAKLTKIYSLDDEILDEGIVIYFKGTASFTGEDIVEFQTHGGVMVSERILNELIRAGARLAMPGEFSKRAFLNGKMDLAKAEAMQGLITSKSEIAAKILTRQMQGDLSKFVGEIRGEVVKTLAFVETMIDYADDDLPANLLEQTKDMLLKNSEKLERIATLSEQRRGLIDGFKIAIVGKPNVGKSSILNSFLAYERAIVSDEAGTTRDRIEENFKIGSHLVRIIDTAGIRKDAGKIEQIGINYSISAINEADIILAVFDGSSLSDDQDKEIIKLVSNSNKKAFFILNKSDLAFKFDINLDGAIKISAKTDTSVVLKELENYLKTQDTDEIMLSSNRQILSCKEASEALKRAFLRLNEEELEIFAYELNTAIKALASITKPFERSEILDEMFSHFCLGK